MAKRIIGSLLLAASSSTLMAAPFVYIPQPQHDRISIFDLSTNTARSPSAREEGKTAQTTTLPVQHNPVAIAANLAGTFVYVVNRDSSSITVINSSNRSVQQSFSVCNQPMAAAVSRNDKNLYVACEGDNSISVIDTSNYSQLKSIPLNNRPSQMVITNGGRLYIMSTAGKTIEALDTTSGEKRLFTINTDVQDPDVNKSAGAPVAMSAQANDMLYVGAADGDVYSWYVADPNSIKRPPRMKILEKPSGTKRAIKAVDNYSGKIYVALQDGDIIFSDALAPSIATQESSTPQPQATISTNTSPTGISIANDLKTVAITNGNSNQVAVISTGDNKVSYVDIGAPSLANGRFISTPSFQMAIASHTQEEDQNSYAWNVIKLQIKRFGDIAGAAKIHYQTESGSAFTKWDFLEAKGDLEFKDGEDTKEITIQIVGDQSVEENENFYLKLSSPGDGYNVGPQSNTEITLVNDDSLPTGAGCSIGYSKEIDPLLPLLATGAFTWLITRKRKPSQAEST